MANYKELEGFGVQTLATDPDNPSWVGSIFYNSTEGVFKTVKPGGISAGTWASAPNLNSSHGDTATGAGTQTAALVMGGSPNQAIVENYNGSSWTEVGDLNTARYQIRAGGGTQTAAIIAGGYVAPTANNSNFVESWNGTSWTEITEINTGRRGATSSHSANSQTAIVIFGGYDGTSPVAITESWNGSAWTELNDIPTGIYVGGGGGTTTSAFIAGGINPTTPTNQSFAWDGTNWSSAPNINTTRAELQGVGGSSDDGLVFGGASGLNAQTEYYDGTSWTEQADLANAKQNSSNHSGTTSAAITGSGRPDPYVGSEEWNAPDVVINTLTTS